MKAPGAVTVTLMALTLLPLRAETSGKLRIVTTFLPVYCFAANVAGHDAEIENLLPAGVGPHDYQFSRRDLRKLTEADIVIVNGLGVDDWLDKAIAVASAAKARKIAALSTGLASELIIGRPRIENGHFVRTSGRAGAPNAHIWLDPLLALHGVTNILRALQRADPAHAAAYAANASDYTDRLLRLDGDINRGLALLRERPLLTYHDAFPYFVRRYGLNLAGIVEEVPDVEPSPRHLTRILQVARQNRVTTLFTEPQFSSRLVGQMASDLKIRVAELDPLESGPLRPTAYEEGMRKNLRVLQAYLR